jgi:Septum formation
MQFRTRRLLCAVVTVPVLATPILAGCSWFGGGNDNGQKSISVFDVKPGECFLAQSDVKAELSSLTSVPCTRAHTQEAYAVVQYGATGTGPSASAAAGAYPGGPLLEKYAKGVCAQRFTAYVGVDYLDSTLFYTYLLPSARSWEQNDDRNVLCFVTTTGGTLKSSVRGSRK